MSVSPHSTKKKTLRNQCLFYFIYTIKNQMLQKDRYITELYDLEHRFDSKSNRHYPFETNILKRSTSPYMWKNENMNEYLTNLEKIIALDVCKMDFARNFMNFTVDKFYNDYWG